MGYRRRRCEGEVTLNPDYSSGFSSCVVRQRRGYLARGAFFLLFTSLVACSREPVASIPARNQIVIGVPEGTSAGDSGITQEARILSLEPLMAAAVDGRVRPRLASSWRTENNGLRLRITLLPNVTLHDRSRLDAALVSRILSAAIKQPGNRALRPSLADIVSVTPSGTNEVVLELAKPSAFVPEDLDVAIQRGNPPQGTGPFRIVSSSKDEAVLVPFDQYRGGAPKLQRIAIKAIPTLRNAWTSLLRGDMDMVTDVPPEAFAFVRNSDVEVVSVPRYYQYLIAFNSRRAPFTSPVVRRALNLAVDRQGLLARVLQNHGAPSTGPLWPQYWAYDASVTPYGYDPSAAASLLDQAGFRMGRAPGSDTAPPARFRFTCLIPDNFTLWERIALEVQRNLYSIGVDMRFKVVPFQQFDSIVRDGDFDAVFVDMIGGLTPGRAYMFWASQKAVHGLNVFGYEDGEAQRLFEGLQASTNEAATRSATQRLQRVFLDDPPALFLTWNERSRAIRTQFRVPGESGDPLLALWRWTPSTPLLTASAQ